MAAESPASLPARAIEPAPQPPAAGGATVAKLPVRSPQPGGLVAPKLDLKRLAARIAEVEALKAPVSQREAELLKLLAALTSAAAVVLYELADEAPKPLHRLIAGPAQAELPAIERAVEAMVRRAGESGGAELDSAEGFATFGVRLPAAGTGRVLALVLQLRRQPPEPFLAVLQLFAALLAGDPAAARQSEAQAAAIKLAQQVAKAEPSAAMALADGLRQATGARSVAVVRLTGKSRARVAAVTGADQLDRRARLPQTLEAAALLVAGSAIVERHRSGAGAGAAFDQLLALTGTQEIVTLPLGTPAVAVALLAFERFEAAAAERLAALVPALPVVAPLLLQARAAKAPKSRLRLVLAVLLLAAGGLMFLPVPHKLTAPLMLTSDSRRVVTAPFDGILAASEVERGQKVTAGQVLARLEDHELRLEWERLSAEAERVSRERDVAIAKGDATEAELKRLEAERARLAADVVAERLAKVAIVSPIDGVVTTDELDQAIGSPLRAGDALFEVAPLGRLTAEIALPAKAITYLPDGAEATLYLEALPGWELTLPVERVSPKAIVRDGANVFELDITLDNADGQLLPGLRGEATIDAGRERLGWVLFHEAWERVERWLR